jgi:hypothetical protein
MVVSTMNLQAMTHWNSVVHVLRYVQHTKDLGITYGPGLDELEGYTDADFATSDPERRRVTSGYVFKFWAGAISYQSKRQPSVTLATGDAEYIALSQAAREMMWLRSLLYELGFDPMGATTIFCDNQSAMQSQRTRSLTRVQSRSIYGFITCANLLNATNCTLSTYPRLQCWRMALPKLCRLST